MSEYDEHLAAHRIDWTIEHEDVTGTFSCVAPDDSFCRASIECECEFLGKAVRADDGRWTHEAEQHDGATDGQVVAHHFHGAPGPCWLLDWFTEPGEKAEYHYGGYGDPLRSGPIVLEWNGDEYVWHYPDAPATSEAP